MALSQDTKALRKQRKALRKELEDPTPEQIAEEEAYWVANPDLLRPDLPKPIE